MQARHVIVIGGGLAGLSAGCHALASGYRVTIVEHNSNLGGVCTSWSRGLYTVDGCIQWLTGGPFLRLYEELGIVPTVGLRTLGSWLVYRDARDGQEIAITRDLDAVFARLTELSGEDAPELERLRHGIREIGAMRMPTDAPELLSVRDTARMFWEARSALPAFLQFSQSVDHWARHHLSSTRLRRLFTRIVPPAAPMLFLMMTLANLEKGHLSRPIGGTASFRDALVRSYQMLGGETALGVTVEEIVVRRGSACGVRLTDGSIVDADVVVSTASTPETIFRLLGGAFAADETQQRMRDWHLIEPILLATFGVSRPYAEVPAKLVVDHVDPLEVGGRVDNALQLRVFNDEPSFAPPGHTVVQVALPSDYDWWARRGLHYRSDKGSVVQSIIGAVEQQLPDFRESICMTDLATPLTYWRAARSWRGAYEGWIPGSDGALGHVRKTLLGLDGFFMAGQWVEPGGGVPMAIMSGRQAVQLMCRADRRPFRGVPEKER